MTEWSELYHMVLGHSDGELGGCGRGMCSLLMNYSYETFYCCWGGSLLLTQILMV